jgi:hypothetical protein
MSLALHGLICCVVYVSTLGCENRVNATAQCLGNGSVTERYHKYTFNIETGPAVDVAGNCQVILTDCDVRAPIGIRASEGATVVVRGGNMIASEMLVMLSGNARVIFENVRTKGRVSLQDAASVIGLSGQH